MRIHIVLDADLIAAIDQRAGERKRSEYIASVLGTFIENEQRWDEIEAGLGCWRAPNTTGTWTLQPGSDRSEATRSARVKGPSE